MAITRIGNIASTIPDDSIQNAKFSNIVDFKNIIINGDMSIAQRGTSVTGSTGGGYLTCDRWNFNIGGAGTWTQTQSTDVPTGQGFPNSFKLDCTTADASLGSGDIMQVQQRIEGQNLQYLKKGTANAESLTCSFWVKSNKTGTYIVEFRERDNNRTISKSYTIDSANTWEKKILTFAGDTTGTINNDNGNSLQVNWWLAAGSNYSSGTLQTSWGTRVDANRAVGQVNLADSTANYINITGVQLEAGTTASEFEFLPVDLNLQRCYRYYYKMDSTVQYARLGIGHATSTTVGSISIFPEVAMRIAPSSVDSSNLGLWKTGAIQSVSAVTIDTTTNTKYSTAINCTSTGLTSGDVYQLIGNNSASSTLALNSEL
jgi:hypothetical protein